MATLQGKDLISIADLTTSDIEKILKLAQKLKKSKVQKKDLAGKSLAIIFEKPSMRTRVSFEVGMWQLGGTTIHLSPRAVEIGVRESIADIAKVLSRYVEGIMYRTFEHKKLVELARYATVPVINGLSDFEHPCQALGDLLTIQEKKGSLKKIKVAYVGDGNNVCHSLMFAADKMGFEMMVATPKGYEPRVRISENQKIRISGDPKEAVKNADVIYTDVWTSMGQEKEFEVRSSKFKDFQVNKQLISLAKKDAIVMHCLPAHRGQEITAEVIDGQQSVVFDQAENRLHAQKAVLLLLLAPRQGSGQGGK